MSARAFRQPAGFSLVEAMVALVVLSVGLLGIAGLFVSSLQSSSSAILRMRAAYFAEDMADRIRANSAAAASYVVDFTANGTDQDCTDTSTVTAVSCTAVMMATHDIRTWKDAIADGQTGLPAGKASIARDTSVTPAEYTITLEWTERDETFDHVLVFRAP